MRFVRSPRNIIRRSVERYREPAHGSFEIEAADVESLTAQIQHSTRYTQRCAEHLSFLPDGGQLWTRKLQIRIPVFSTPVADAWRPISLGPFKQRRFPDIEVYDGGGNRIPLLTRDQHGTAVTDRLLAKHFRGLAERLESVTDEAYLERLRARYDKLRYALFAISTTITESDAEIETLVSQTVDLFKSLLREFDISVSSLRLDAFAHDIETTAKTTEYLCWVRAAPGDVINLCVTHTSEDVVHDLAPLKSAGEAADAISAGIVEPRDERRKVRAKWAVQYGLAPIKYTFKVSSHARAGSYYFTMQPPESTDVTIA